MLVTDTVYSNDTLEVNSRIQRLLSLLQLFLMFYFEPALPEKKIIITVQKNTSLLLPDFFFILISDQSSGVVYKMKEQYG